MRYPASEKIEIIRIVEQSSLSAGKTLQQIRSLSKNHSTRGRFWTQKGGRSWTRFDTQNEQRAAKTAKCGFNLTIPASMPRCANISSISRKLSVKRKWSQTARQMSPAETHGV
jgi:hypothetical protein